MRKTEAVESESVEPARTAIVWFRNDLRVADNPALYEAVSENEKVAALYILEEDESLLGAAGRSWLHHSLLALQQSLEKLNIPLVLHRGSPVGVFSRISSQVPFGAVYWNRRYEPRSIASDKQTKTFLKENGISCFTYKASLLLEPWEIANQSKKPYQVFTAFWRQHQRIYSHKRSLPEPAPQIAFECKISSCQLEDFELKPSINWDAGFYECFSPGEKSAQRVLRAFSKQSLADYEVGRDVPSLSGTSRISPHLRFGEISPRQIIDEIAFSGSHQVQLYEPFVRQIVWREFANHILYHFPHTATSPLKPSFEKFPWRGNSENLEKWKHGRTGVPIVDAGMRELWATGWMHNRVRMIVASFLTKNLLIDWRKGADWFWETLVDADLANNTMGWQWVAGCGADAAPYFRIFNPVLQSQKFDPKGGYIKKWIPELRQLPHKQVHAPWKWPSVLKSTGYPDICCSLIESRATALYAYDQIRTNN